MADQEERRSTSRSEARRHAQPVAAAASSDGPHPPANEQQHNADSNDNKGSSNNDDDDDDNSNNNILPATAMEASDGVAPPRLTTEAASGAVPENSRAGDRVDAELKGGGTHTVPARTDDETEFVEVHLQDGKPEQPGQPGQGTSSRIPLFVLICNRGGRGGSSAD